jgi:hypothetical protein
LKRRLSLVADIERDGIVRLLRKPRGLRRVERGSRPSQTTAIEERAVVAREGSRSLLKKAEHWLGRAESS